MFPKKKFKMDPVIQRAMDAVKSDTEDEGND